MAARRALLSATTLHVQHGLILLFLILDSGYGQDKTYGRYYNSQHQPPPQNNDQQSYYYNQYSQGYQDPFSRDRPSVRRRPEDGYRPVDPSPRPDVKGVLAGWREDIQGKERPDSKNLDRDVFITTDYGQVQGFKVYLYDDPEARHRPPNPSIEPVTRSVNSFLGIPYASAPIEELRFRPPKPHKGWQSWQAVDWGPACPQPSAYTGATKGIRDVSEDCLYLNIFTPNTSKGVARPYPVMFYIHGGDFIHGASNLFPGHMLAGFYDVIVVTFNYRLGALGFLSTGDENSLGNYGLQDQAMALRWVYDNIHSFNGDREKITLFGPDAGAASAGLLAISPITRHMVSKVIAQSGSVLADWAVIIDKYRAQNTSKVFAQSLGCSTHSSMQLMECLKFRNYFELGNADINPEIGMFPWAPVYDRNFTVPRYYFDNWDPKEWRFFSEIPEESIRKGKFNNNFMYMSGVTTQEAADIVANNATLARNDYIIDEEAFNQKVWEMVLRYNYTLNPEGVYEAIKYMYTYWPDPRNVTHIREQYIKLLSDFHYVAPADKLAKLLLEKQVPMYLYVMNTTIEAFKYPEWRKVPHNIEQMLLTGAPFMDNEFFPSRLNFKRSMWTDNDRNMSNFFMRAFSNFATYGNPTPSQILTLYMERVRPGELRYLNINTTFNSSIMVNYRQTESAFWSMYLPTVIGRLAPIYPPDPIYFWEQTQPMQIAFWSMSAACMLLIVLSVVCCMLWRNAKRQSDHYYSGDVLMVRDEDPSEGIENITRASKENMYEYRDTPPVRPRNPRNEARHAERLAHNRKFSSTPSLRTNSNVSLKDVRSEGFVTSSPNGQPRINKASSQASLQKAKSKTHLIQGIPQTAV